MDSPTFERAPDTGIVTLWFSCNYGAILTTFALYRLLEQMGRQPLILDQSELCGCSKWSDENNISRSFMRRCMLRCSEPLRTDKDLQSLNETLQTFIIGSDQVWRWAYTYPYGLFFFLDFVRGDKRKIAVASSFGIDTEERPADSMRKAGYFLHSFDAVSVREQSGLELLRRHYGVAGECILDPVFLCGKECYEELLKNIEVPQKPYLLSYVLEPDEKIRKLIEYIADERGLEIINIVDAQGDCEKLRARFGGIGNIAQGITPEQWLAYIRSCSFFVTDSFHGICFAHLYHKSFVCVAPPERGLTRFTSLLNLTGLSHCLLPPDHTEQGIAAATAPIDWHSVQKSISEATEKGKAWVKHALSAPRDTQTQALAELVFECIHAGNGAAERHPSLETQVLQKCTYYRAYTLPQIFRFKAACLQCLLLLCPIPAQRKKLRSRIQNQRRLAAYLKTTSA